MKGGASRNQVSPGHPEGKGTASPWRNRLARPAPRRQGAGRRGVVTPRQENFPQSEGLSPPLGPRCGAGQSPNPMARLDPDSLPSCRSSRTVAAAAPEPRAGRPGRARPPSPPSMLAGAGEMASAAARPAQVMTQNPGAASSAHPAVLGIPLCCSWWADPGWERRGAQNRWAPRPQRTREAEVVGPALSPVSRRAPGAGGVPWAEEQVSAGTWRQRSPLKQVFNLRMGPLDGSTRRERRFLVASCARHKHSWRALIATHLYLSQPLRRVLGIKAGGKSLGRKVARDESGEN